MAKTYAQLNAEIEALKAKADSARKREAAGVVARIKQAIAAYGLTAADLGLGSAARRGGLAATNISPAKTAKQKKKGQSQVPVKYRDSAGNRWSGRGSRPRWLVAALAAGQPLEAFAVDGASAQPSPLGKSRRGTKNGTLLESKKKAPAAKYRDGDKSWSGRGPKPGWVKQALAAGKTLDDLRR